MKLIRLNVEDPLLAIRCLTPGYLSDKGERVTFIQQPQFSAGSVNRAGVHKDSSLDQVPMYISYHATDISLSIRATIRFRFLLTNINILFHCRFIVEKIPMIH